MNAGSSAAIQSPKTYQALETQATRRVASPTQVQGLTQTPNPTGVTSDVSRTGQLLANLEQMKEANPEQFKQLMTQIASQLSAAAQQQGQGPDAHFLANLAATFKNVAETGDLAALQPAKNTNPIRQAYSQGAHTPQQVLLNIIESPNHLRSLEEGTRHLLSNVVGSVKKAAGL